MGIAMMYNAIERLCAGCGTLQDHLVCMDWLSLLYRLANNGVGGWYDTMLTFI